MGTAAAGPHRSKRRHDRIGLTASISASLANTKMRYSYIASGERRSHGGRLVRSTPQLPWAKGKDPIMASETTPATVAERVDAHDAAARQAVRVAACDYQAHVATIAAAHIGERCVWQAPRDVAASDWDRALGAAAGLEELADVLGVVLTDDHRRHLPPQGR